MDSLGPPKPSTWLPGQAMASAGLRRWRPGPWADWAGVHAQARLTPRVRSSVYPRRPHGFHS
jgi:hypothetical protein